MAEVTIIFLVGLYFLPTIIAATRHKQNTLAIGALNFFLGWSFIGWIVALIWALSADPQIHQHVVNVSQNVSMPYYPQGGMPQGTEATYVPPHEMPRPAYPVTQEPPAAAPPAQHVRQYQPPGDT